MSLQDKILEQLALLRKLTETTSIIHDAQVIQLQGWVRLAFKGVTKIELRFDFTGKVCEYHLTMAPRIKVKSTSAKKKWLTKNVQFLLGEDWRVVLYKGEKKL